MQLKLIAGWLLAILLLAATPTWAAKLVLKDGTVLQGTAIKTSDGYWVKLPDGTTRTVDDTDIASVDLSSGEDSAPETRPAGGSVAFQAAQYRVSLVQSSMAAVAIWQEFIDRNPDSPDLPAAQKELARWKALAATGAEKINGKWVGGAERAKIIDDAADLTRQAVDMINQHQTLQAIEKLRASIKIYPNSFQTNFAMGNVSMDQMNYDQATQYYNAAFKINSQSFEAENNLAVANFLCRRWDAAIQGFLDAAKIEDNKLIAQNLVTALGLAPDAYRTLPRMKDTRQAANLLANEYSITGPTRDFALMPIPRIGTSPRPDPTNPRNLLAWSGTGFFINDTGLILTNRHVAKDSKTRLVIMSDGTQVSADIVAIDDQYDLALLRIVQKKTAKVPFIHLSLADSPAEGADCVVMGFPMINQFGEDIKITRGVVSSASQTQGNGADVLTDAKVNPGNSGGPILDNFGSAMAIVSMKTITSGEFDSYGIGISAGHIRDFLKRNKVDVTSADAASAPLTTEQIVAKVKPATVCIQCTN